MIMIRAAVWVSGKIYSNMIINAYRFHIFSGFHERLHFSKSKTRVVSISIFKAEYGITMHTNSHIIYNKMYS